MAVDVALQGGIGIELWTMTEDILFSNIYIGHSLEDAKALAAETFDVKKRLEAAEKKAAEDHEATEGQIVFKEDPVAFIREKVFEFIELARLDPLYAAKSRPETAAGLALATVTFFGMLAVFVTSLFGGQSKPVAKVSLTSSLDCCVEFLMIAFSPPRKPMLPHLTTNPRLILLLCPKPEMTRRTKVGLKSESKALPWITGFVVIRSTI